MDPELVRTMPVIISILLGAMLTSAIIGAQAMVDLPKTKKTRSFVKNIGSIHLEVVICFVIAYIFTPRDSEIFQFINLFAIATCLIDILVLFYGIYYFRTIKQAEQNHVEEPKPSQS